MGGTTNRWTRAGPACFPRKLSPKNTLSDFEKMLDESGWTFEVINESETWIANDDNTFQIVRGKRTDDFRERWTDSTRIETVPLSGLSKDQ